MTTATVTPPSEKDIAALRNQFIEATGHITQGLGFGRIIGQIFAHLYLSRAPQSLDDLADTLGISKGSASMTVRQLEQWSAVRRVWVKGDRKDYYETTEEFGKIVRRALLDMIGQQMETVDRLLQQADITLGPQKSSAPPNEELDLMRRKLDRVQRFRQRAQGLWESSIIQFFMKK